jgi:hypothetical protein
MTPRARGGGPAVDPDRAVGCLLGLAILAAPFLAVLYDLDAGLAVMAVALGAAAYLALQALPAADATLARRLRLVAGVNAVLAAACLAMLALRWA